MCLWKIVLLSRIVTLRHCTNTFFFCKWFWHFRDFFESICGISVIIVILRFTKTGKMKHYYTKKVIIYFIFCILDTWVKFMVHYCLKKYFDFFFWIQVNIQPGQDFTYIQKVLCRKGPGGLLLICTRVILVPLTFRGLYILHTTEIFW